MENIKDLINNYLLVKKDDTDLFDVLHIEQSQIGCIPEDIQKFIAARMCLELSEVHEVIEISSSFQEKKQISVTVCSGSGCTMKGSMEILGIISKELGVNLNDEDKSVFLTVKNCFKACSYGVNIEVNGELFHNVTVSTLGRVLEKIKFYY